MSAKLGSCTTTGIQMRAIFCQDVKTSVTRSLKEFLIQVLLSRLMIISNQ